MNIPHDKINVVPGSGIYLYEVSSFFKKLFTLYLSIAN